MGFRGSGGGGGAGCCCDCEYKVLAVYDCE